MLKRSEEKKYFLENKMCENFTKASKFYSPGLDIFRSIRINLNSATLTLKMIYLVRKAFLLIIITLKKNVNISMILR